VGGLRGRDDHVAEYDNAEHDDPEHDAAQFGELPEHGLVVRLVELVRCRLRHAGRRVNGGGAPPERRPSLHLIRG